MQKNSKPKFRWAKRTLAIMFISSLLGCDTMVLYQFEVANESAKSIDVAFKTPQIDTTMHIDAGLSKVILERNQLNSGIKPYFEGSDTIWWFSKLAITSADSEVVSKEIRVASAWTFSEKDKRTGLYRLVLKDSDFQ
jgi:hypothetical protein